MQMIVHKNPRALVVLALTAIAALAALLSLSNIDWVMTKSFMGLVMIYMLLFTIKLVIGHMWVVILAIALCLGGGLLMHKAGN